MRVMFMGTPDFASVSLRAILDAGYDVCAVVTKPDKPRGRGMKVIAPPVKALAQEHNIDILQPESLKNESFLPELDKYKPDIIVVVAYGKILPKYVLDFPRLGCVNVHGSLLPKYRGAAPVQWAIINGEEETGVTTMFMDEGMDTGDMIYKASAPIYPEDNAEKLFSRLSRMGAELLLKTLSSVEKGDAPREKQDSGKATYAPVITKEVCKLDFSRPAKNVLNLIRGLSPSPCAYFEIDGVVFKVLSAAPGGVTKKQAGTVLCADAKRGLEIACSDGETIKIEEIIPQGAKKMTACQYLAGHRIETDMILK